MSGAVDFTVEAAKVRYRAAWRRYYMLTDGGLWESVQATEEVKEECAALRAEMDVAQLLICRGPGPEWNAFVDTLPGFREAWSLTGGVKRMIIESTEGEA